MDMASMARASGEIVAFMVAFGRRPNRPDWRYRLNPFEKRSRLSGRCCHDWA